MMLFSVACIGDDDDDDSAPAEAEGFASPRESRRFEFDFLLTSAANARRLRASVGFRREVLARLWGSTSSPLFSDPERDPDELVRLVFLGGPSESEIVRMS